MDPNTPVSTFGDRLRKARRDANLTQAVLAERAGLSVRTIEHLEGARGQPFAHSAVQLADALGLTGDARNDFLATARRLNRSRVTQPERQPVATLPQLNPRNTLPIALATFVGRERELAEVRQLLTRVRLLTLTGPGGIGKTRLAIEVARGLSGTDADDICWVELAPLTDAGLVSEAVASALGVPEQSGRPALEVLVDALSMRQLLLILDNCEHLVATCAALADTLLRHCPGLRILTTSRQPLGVDGEKTWRVPGLPAIEATRLFVERAQAVEPEWTLTERNASGVAQVCEHVDGIPLAIEFAAARVVVLAPEQIAERLADRFALLTATVRTALARHQTLRATLDWSYGLLPAEEQLLFDRLAVFAGGWSIEAAETVCAGGGIQLGNVLDLLRRLVDQSMVLAVHTEDGTVRYRLLETLREYARERLEGRAETDALSGRHAEFFLALVEHDEPELLGAHWRAAQANLAREQDNIRTALRWLVARGDTERAERLAGSLARFWFFLGHFGEGSGWLAQVLALSPVRRTAGRAKSLHGAGTIAMMRGEFSAAESALHEALSIWREVGDVAQQAFVLFVLGMVARQRGAFADARQRFEQGLVASRAVRCAPAEANNLAGLADVEREYGQFARARTYGQQALRCASAAYYLRGEVHALRALGEVAYETGDYEAATGLLEAGLARSRDLGAQWLSAWALARLALLAIERGESSAADALLAESLTLAQHMGDRQGVARCLEGLAQLPRVQERPATAVRLAAAAAAIRAAIGVPLPPLEGTRLEERLRTVRELLGESASEAVWAEGQCLSWRQAVALAASSMTAEPALTDSDGL